MKIRLAVIAAALALAGCSSEDKPLPKTPVELGYKFNFATMNVAMDDAGVNPLFRKVDLAWSEPVFDPEYCDYEEGFCEQELQSVDLCAVSATSENQCEVVNADIKNDGAPISLDNLALGANQELFLLANYAHGSYPSNKLSFTAAQYDAFAKTFGRGLPDLITNTRFGETIDISGDGTVVVVADTNAQRQTDPFSYGEVYIYDRTDDGYSLSFNFPQPDMSYNSNFGDVLSVSDSGNTVVALASYDRSCSTDILNPDQLCNSATNQLGAFYVIETDGVNAHTVAMVKPTKDHGLEEFNSVAVSGDGSVVYLGSYIESTDEMHLRSYTKSNLGVWEQEYSKRVPLPYTHKVYDMDISNDGKTLVLSDGEDMLLVYARTDGGIENTQQLLNPFGTHIEEAEGVSISGDGNTIAAGYPNLEAGFDEGNQGGFAIYKRNVSGMFELVQKGFPEYVDQRGEFGQGTGINYDGTKIFFSAPETRWDNSDGAVVIGEPRLNWRFDGYTGSISVYVEQLDGSYKHESLINPPSIIDYGSDFVEGDHPLAVSDNGVVVGGAPDFVDGLKTGGFFVY